MFLQGFSVLGFRFSVLGLHVLFGRSFCCVDTRVVLGHGSPISFVLGGSGAGCVWVGAYDG